MSISGHSFYESGGDVIELLRRNMMDAYSVWWVARGVGVVCV